jgi:hypothetical protein
MPQPGAECRRRSVSGATLGAYLGRSAERGRTTATLQFARSPPLLLLLLLPPPPAPLRVARNSCMLRSASRRTSSEVRRTPALVRPSVGEVSYKQRSFVIEESKFRLETSETTNPGNIFSSN